MGGGAWARFGFGLPNVPVYEISIDETHGRVYAATHGRGVFVLTQPLLSNFEGWVNDQIWDIAVYGTGYLPNQSCTMQIIQQNGAVCAQGSTDAQGGAITTDSIGQLVTSNSGFYNGRPVAWACFNGACVGNRDISFCNQPDNPITSVVVACTGVFGAETGTDLILGCPQQATPPSSFLGWSPNGVGGVAALAREAVAAPAAGSFEVIASVQAMDSSRSLCRVSVPFQSSDTQEEVLLRARDALNDNPICQTNTVSAEVLGTRPSNQPLEEDEPLSDPKLFLTAPGVSGSILIPSLRAAPGQATGNLFHLGGLGVPVLNTLSIMQVKFETASRGAAGGKMTVIERSSLGSCAVTVSITPGSTGTEIAAAVAAAFQAPGIPGPHPACPASQNPRDITQDDNSIIAVVASELLVHNTDAAVGFLLQPDQLVLPPGDPNLPPFRR